MSASDLIQAAAAKIAEAEKVGKEAAGKAAETLQKKEAKNRLASGLTSWMRSHVEARTNRFEEVAQEGEDLLKQSADTVGALMEKSRRQDAAIKKKEDTIQSSQAEIERLQYEVERLTMDQSVISDQSRRLRERILRLEGESQASPSAPFAPGAHRRTATSTAAYGRRSPTKA